MKGVRMAALVALVVTARPPDRLTAQVSLHLAAGVRYSSTLVHDSIVTPFDLRPAIGPALSITVLERTPGSWTPDATLDVSWGSLQRHDASAGGGGSSRINSLTTLALTVGVRHGIQAGLSVRAGVGGLKYLPGDATGMFRSGSGIAALGAVALEWAPPAASRHGLGLSLRYDAHRFLTSALRTAGFTEPRLVHRVAIGVRARVAGRDGGTR